MKKLLWVFAVLGLLSLLGAIAGVVFFAVRTLKPDLIDTGLQKEMSALGVTLGTATAEDLTARFGAPQQTKQESLSTVYLYSTKGLLFRIDKKTGKLIWYEITAKEYATAKGIKVGATYDDVLDAYGATKYVTLLPSGTRVRYKYGTAFFMEFWLSKVGRVEKIALYHS